MKIFLITILILSSAAAASFAQTRKFRWTTELCEFEGAYNAKKYTAAKLRNTLKLFAPESFNIEADATPQTFEGIKRLQIDALDKEYNLKSTALKNLDIVKSKYWEALRQRKLNELEQVYRLSRVTMQAYDNPVLLKEYSSAASCVKIYANPLINGGDELLGTWRKVNEDLRRKNASPERLRNIFDQQYSSPDKYKYARIEVMTFGWWNCANEFIEYEEGYERHEKEFKKLFTRVKTVGCDEP